jgi:hypothetical protein
VVKNYAGGRHVQSHDSENAAARLLQRSGNPKRAYIIEVAGIATLVLCITLLAGFVIPFGDAGSAFNVPAMKQDEA